MNESFTVLDEIADCKRLFDELEGSLTAGWDLMYQKACDYYEKYGDLMVPAKYITEDGCALGNWLNIQRKAYAGKTNRALTLDQINRLERIGIVWQNHLDYIWDRYYSAARQYYEEHGNLKIANDYETIDGLKLGVWIQRMRSAKAEERNAVLTADKEEKLNRIGMIWNMVSSQWEENYLTALHYFNTHGNLDVPLRYIAENGIRLGSWISHLRQKRNGRGRGSALTQMQVNRLDEIGMIWSPEQYRFDIGLRNAQEYYTKYGNLRVPVSYCSDDGFELGKWIRLKRRQYKTGSLSQDNIQRLEAIGMLWDVFSENWYEMYMQAKAYFDNNGNLNVPRNYIAANGKRLDSWLGKMRREMHNLTNEQLEMLAHIGFVDH